MADYAKDASDRARKLRSTNKAKDDAHPLGGKPAKMGETYMSGPKGIDGRAGLYNEKAASEAYDHTMNVRESEAEDQEERSKRAGRSAGEIGKKWSDTFK